VKIISNAGPLITLSQVGQLNLLKELYGTIIIPETVQYEVVVQQCSVTFPRGTKRYFGIAKRLQTPSSTKLNYRDSFFSRDKLQRCPATANFYRDKSSNILTYP
jgi:hypothetical protein